jgi:hypothetical protein
MLSHEFFCSARSGFVLEGEQRRFNPKPEGVPWVSLSGGLPE